MYGKMVAITPVLVLLISVAGFAQRGQQPQPPTQPRQPNDYVIRGKLIFTNGGPDERIEVRLERPGKQVVQTQYTDGLGNFEFQGVPPAQYFIAVNLDGYEEVHEEVRMVAGFGREVTANVFMSKPSVTVDDTGDAGTVDISQLSIPKKAVEEYEKAQEDSRKGDIDKAVKRLEEAIRIAPDYYLAHNSLGIHYQKMNRFRDAEMEFQRAREINPRGLEPLINLGSLFIQESDARKDEGRRVVGRILDDALDVLELAVKEMPQSAIAHYYLGTANYKSDFYPEAEAALNTAIEIDPKLGGARLMLVNVYLKQQRWEPLLEQLNIFLDQNRDAPNREAVERMRSQVMKLLETPAQ